ncbi:MocR-like pyridoxine biosynthesis transcription factor PdxR [Streptomyces spirodelae]|uniref:PLP-dependent aminotransferase family protein n=1 Tax=Streptomyces spirodelae TaxID=2812904 RepID=A0ABS3WMD7_9ACTN|nr:PLP-dependent aminotransferase family protein [Streptomyces spirodelae]MBO8184293.1 PLP-dependent aminotransferase family protein [Streptomyces spirodelae]
MNRANGSAVDRTIKGGSTAPAASDFLQLTADAVPRGGLSDWLVGRIRQAIADGRLLTGSRLPATRVLAADLKVSRGVVTEAYRRLVDDGHVVGRGRAGTVVAATPLNGTGGAAGSTGAAPAGPAATDVFDAPPGADVFDAFRTSTARIDLSPGLPDLAAFPRTAWLRAERAVLAELASSDLGYGDPRGTRALRGAVAGWLRVNRGITAEPEEIIIVAGTAQALGLLAQVLRAEGADRLAVEDPSSLGARQHLHSWGLATPPVPVDAEGVRVDALQATGAPAVLLTPAHQFPTGVVLGGERRRELVRWAGEGGLVIEDDYDAEHRYDRAPVAALAAMAPDHVCYSGSISKLLAPALRVGWLLAPARYRDALTDAKRFADLGNAALPQLVLARLMESGALERHLRLIRRRHRVRRDAMIAAIRSHLPHARVHGAAAGLHLTVTFPSGVRDTELASRALAHGVKTQPLSWHTQLPGRPGLVLGYAAAAPTAIAEGIAVLGTLLTADGRPGGAAPGRAQMPGR